MSTMTGPHQTRDDARTAAHMVALLADRTVMDGAIALFETSLEGIELGTYDRRIIDWLEGWEPETLAVLAGIITRAKAMQP
jgi:hypothetical protein